VGVQKNVLVQKYNGTDHDVLFPVTTTDNVFDEQGNRLTDSLVNVQADPFYSEITYSKYIDSVTGTPYVITKIPNRDKNDQLIPLKHGYPNEQMNGVFDTALSYSVQHNASFVANASRWNTTNGQIYGIQIKDGKVLQDTPHGQNYTLGIKQDNTLVAYPPTADASAILADGCIQAVSGFYPLIQNGQTVDPSIYQSDGDPNGYDPRQVIGQMPNLDIVFLTAEGRNPNTNKDQGLMYSDIIRIMQGIGVKFAYNLDGGGSEQTVVRGVLTTNPTDNNGQTVRLVADFLYVDRPTDTLKKLNSLNQDLGYLSQRIADLYAQIEYLTDLNQGYLNLRGAPGYNAQGIATYTGNVADTKLYLRSGDMSYWDYVNNDYMFRVHATGELQTTRGQIADYFSVPPQVTDLNNIGYNHSSEVWATGTTANVPNSSCSWFVRHIYYDTNDMLQIAYPYSEDTSIHPQMRRTGGDGSWQVWRAF
jgi:hypothetical protein